MGLLACVLLGALLFVLGVLVFPRYHAPWHARTTAFRHSEPWVAAGAWGAGLVLLFLAFGSYWQDLPEPVQELAAPIMAPSPVATPPLTQPAVKATAKPAPSKTNKPVAQKPPSPIPSPVAPVAPPSPVPSPLAVTITDATYGTIKAKTEPGAQCTASVALPDGKTISKTRAKTATSTGSVTWTYTKVLGLQGTGTAKVGCSLNGRTGSAARTFTITSASPGPIPTPSPTPTG